MRGIEFGAIKKHPHHDGSTAQADQKSDENGLIPSPKERIKEYKSLALTPAAAVKFKFLMPEAVFWDDTDRFSGSFEDSHSVTKFRYDTDLLWKEEKER